MSIDALQSAFDAVLAELAPSAAVKSLHFAARMASHRARGRQGIPWVYAGVGEPTALERSAAVQLIDAAERVLNKRLLEWNDANVRDVTEALATRAVHFAGGQRKQDRDKARRFLEACRADTGSDLTPTSIWSRSVADLLIRGSVEPREPVVFVVHGRDAAIAQEVVSLLRNLRVKPQLLSDVPYRGRTILEALEEHASTVGFAIVVMTADESMRARGEVVTRPRQNVVFELGYFIGRLGRERVCVLIEPGVEIPSDFASVVYFDLDAANAWKLKLASELRVAGFDINLETSPL